MRSSFDYYNRIENPEMYLCNPDQRFLCALMGEDRHLTLRFNDLSELSFTVPKIEGTEDNYNLIESKRLIFVDKIGWFQITSVSETVEGDKCTKNISAKSHQTIFADRGFVTEERVYMFYNPNDWNDSNYTRLAEESSLDANIKAEYQKAIPSIVGQLNRQLGIKVALDNDDIEPTYDRKDWTIIYIDPNLKFHSQSYDAMYEPAEPTEEDSWKNICRSFEANTGTNGYDFMVNKVEEAFEVVFEFDFLYHTIKVKTLDKITTPTNIYLSFENVINSIDIKENAEDIVTVMTCEGNDIDIRTVNPMGTNYIVDFSYYKQKEEKSEGVYEYPWMSKELIKALDKWEKEFEKWQKDDETRTDHTEGYSSLVKSIQELYEKKTQSDANIQYANIKLTDMRAARDQHIDGDDKVSDDESDSLAGSGFITAESVKVEGKSLIDASDFYNEMFTDTVTLEGHKKAPVAKKVNDDDENNTYHYEFEFQEDSNNEITDGAACSLIEAYIDSDKAEDNASVPLYFMDGDNRSYCKLTVKSEVGVVKDVNGNISNSGTVEVRGENEKITFSVEFNNGVYNITLPDGTIQETTQSNSYFVYNGTRYRLVASADGIVTVYSFYVSGFERYTTYAEASNWCSIWEKHINNDLMATNNELQQYIDEIDGKMKYICDQCNIEGYIKSEGDKIGKDLYGELSAYWVEGSYNNENFATYDSTTMAERIDLANDLMNAAKVDLKKSSQPQYEMTVDAINFIKIPEFKQFTDELSLGREITIEKEDGVCYGLALMTIEYDLDTTDTFSMTFSNASRPGDTTITFADLIKESSSVSRTVSANWSNLTDYSRNKTEISDMILSPLNRTLRAAKKNMANQAFVIDESGILGRKYSEVSDSEFSQQQMRIMNNVILFTDNDWKTVRTALGNISYVDEYGEEKKAYGLVADVLVGNLILGSEMAIGSRSKRVLINDDGITIKNDNGDAVFGADEDGNLTLRGTVTATAGEIGGFTIGAESIYNGITTFESESKDGEGIYIGINGINAGGNFTVDKSGNVKILKGNIKLGKREDNDRAYEASLDPKVFEMIDDLTFNGKQQKYGCKINSGELRLIKSEQISQPGDNHSLLIKPADGTQGYEIMSLQSLTLGATSGGTLPSASIYIDEGGGELRGILWKLSTGGTISSDRNLKHNIEQLNDLYTKVFDLLKPCRFKYNSGTSGRYHTGFIAQEVEEAIISAGITTNDMAAFVRNNKDECSLRYSELIALCVNEIQKIKQAINNLLKEK